ncbi:uncharacterized protein LOC119091320 isoform X1 [Pollicipes pollicipes]|uniref:uncharacterized protein LOC119091320 isoform X1 n=1 Tax=Pollicipes pollicipes TaxID=41117 RepID=UPI0018859812|nr:uncharacterized protein LOC119091320 isoform X1 [Pollicipes pollicipes]XP_037069927.1 uncharacterized protein LOC119091320 isoform X1 [Pollicipes pollicipes]
MAHADFANCNGGTEGNTVVPTAPPQEGDHNYDPPPTYAEATGTIGGGGPVPGRLEAGLAPATMPALPTGPGFNDSPDPVRAAAATWAVTRTGGDGDAPPSYQSLFGQIKEAREKSTSICDFFATVFLMPLGFLVALGRTNDSACRASTSMERRRPQCAATSLTLLTRSLTEVCCGTASAPASGPVVWTVLGTCCSGRPRGLLVGPASGSVVRTGLEACRSGRPRGLLFRPASGPAGWTGLGACCLDRPRSLLSGPAWGSVVWTGLGVCRRPVSGPAVWTGLGVCRLNRPRSLWSGPATGLVVWTGLRVCRLNRPRSLWSGPASGPVVRAGLGT